MVIIMKSIKHVLLTLISVLVFTTFAAKAESLYGTWTFGRVNGPVLCTLTLTDKKGQYGNVLKGCHANESYWILTSGGLLFKHADGSVTSRLTRRSSNYWEGPYIPHPSVPVQGIRHYISRDSGGRGRDCPPGYNPYGCN